MLLRMKLSPIFLSSYFYNYLLCVHAVAEDWIVSTPPTAYETEPIRFQNEDNDFLNNMFRAQAQYLDNQMISFYKFRVYSEREGYSETILTSNADIPVNKVYLMTQDKDFSGVISRPISGESPRRQ